MKVIFVRCTNDYDALSFEENFTPNLELWNEIKNGKVLNILFEDSYEELNVEALEFGIVDEVFIKFIQNQVQDYDQSKHTNFYVVKE